MPYQQQQEDPDLLIRALQKIDDLYMSFGPGIVETAAKRLFDLAKGDVRHSGGAEYVARDQARRAQVRDIYQQEVIGGSAGPAEGVLQRRMGAVGPSDAVRREMLQRRMAGFGLPHEEILEGRTGSAGQIPDAQRQEMLRRRLTGFGLPHEEMLRRRLTGR